MVHARREGHQHAIRAAPNEGATCMQGGRAISMQSGPPPTKEPPACKEGGPSACNQGPKKARAAPAMKEDWKSHLPRLPAAEESGMSTVREW